MTTPIEEAFVRVTADTDPASRAIRAFARDATRQFNQLSSSTRATSRAFDRLGSAAPNNLADFEAPAARAGALLENLTERAVALTAALSALRPAITRVTAALRRLDAQGTAAVARLTQLQERLQSVSSSTQSLGESTGRATENLQQLGQSVARTSASTRRVSQATEETTRSTDRFGFSLQGLRERLSNVDFNLSRMRIGAGLLATSVATAVPAVASVGAAMAQLAPASAGAVSGFVAIRQAAAVVKLSMVGVEDAITSVFDTSAGGAKKLQESLKNLAPSARAFVLAIQDLRPQLVAFQQAVQGRVFDGFAERLKGVATAVLPALRSGFLATAGTLNTMGLGVADAAQNLGTSGVLGRALSGAASGLNNLVRIPGQVVTGLGQIAAAGAPAFNTLTSAIARVADRVSKKLSTAFASGALQKAINNAVTLVSQLVRSVANLGGALRNVLGTVSEASGGLFAGLERLTGVLRDATAAQGFQAAMRSLGSVLSTLGQTVGPLLAQVFGAIGPIITALAPPLQAVIQALGAGLSPLLTGLSPVLTAVAGAFGALIAAIAPLLTTIGTLAGALLPILVPPLNTLRQIFTLLAPSVAQLGTALTGLLQPVFAALPGLIAPVTTLLSTLAQSVLPVLSTLLVQLTPSFAQLGVSLGQVLVAATPLLAVLAKMVSGVLISIVPIIAQLVPLIASFASVLAGSLAAVLNGVVVPALRVVSAVFRGDFAGAVRSAGQLVTGTFRAIAAGIGGSIGLATSVVRTFGSVLVSTFSGAVGIAKSLFGGLVNTIGGALSSLVGLARSAVGDMRAAFTGGGWSGIGSQIISGLVSGIRGGLGWVVSAARGVASAAVSAAKSALGISSPSRVFRRIGRDTGRGFILGLTRVAFAKTAARVARDTGAAFVRGLTGTQARIKATADSISRTISGAFLGKRTRVDDRLVGLVARGNQRLQGLARQRDALAKRIADAQKFASDLATRTRETFSLANLTQNNISRASILGGLEDGAKKIRQFSSQLRQLQKRGLRKDLISQLLQLGPEQGRLIARTLLDQSRSTLRSINAQQAAVARASTSLGRFGADVLFDAGKKAGAGFLTGLKAQRKNIERLMLSIAKSMQKAIRRALRIKSPSGVFRDLGDDTGAGLELGLVSHIPRLQKAVRSAAAAMAQVGGTQLPAMLTPPPQVTGVGSLRAAPVARQGDTVVNLTVVNRGVLGGRAEVLNWLTESLDTLQRQRRVRVA